MTAFTRPLPHFSIDLAAIYREYQPKIENYIFRRTSDPTLTEDLTAQVFLNVLEATQAGKGAHTHLSGWLYRIAHNLVIDHYRKRDRQRLTDLEPHLPDSAKSPLEAAYMAFDTEMLHVAMRSLTDEQAQVILLRFVEGYPFGEIAATMDKTEGAVKALQSRGLASLRSLLAERMKA